MVWFLFFSLGFHTKYWELRIKNKLKRMSLIDDGYDLTKTILLRLIPSTVIWYNANALEINKSHFFSIRYTFLVGWFFKGLFICLTCIKKFAYYFSMLILFLRFVMYGELIVYRAYCICKKNLNFWCRWWCDGRCIRILFSQNNYIYVMPGCLWICLEIYSCLYVVMVYGWIELNNLYRYKYEAWIRNELWIMRTILMIDCLVVFSYGI